MYLQPLRWVPAALFAVGLSVPSSGLSHASGVTSAALGSSGCNACHGGGREPRVTLALSEHSILAGQPVTFTLTVSTTNGSCAGLNIRTSAAGLFEVGGTDAASTKTTASGTEMTQTSCKSSGGDNVVFTGVWTPAPSTSGAVTFTAWGLSANGDGSKTGDSSAAATATVAVVAAQQDGGMATDGSMHEDGAVEPDAGQDVDGGTAADAAGQRDSGPAGEVDAAPDGGSAGDGGGLLDAQGVSGNSDVSAGNGAQGMPSDTEHPSSRALRGGCSQVAQEEMSRRWLPWVLVVVGGAIGSGTRRRSRMR